MVGNNEDRGRSRRLSVEDRGWSSIGRVLDSRTIERSGDVVCGLHHAQGDEEHVFLCLASKPRSVFPPGLASKAVSMISPGLASKLVVTVLVVWPQNHSLGFSGLGPKLAAAVW
jgi:hypothetical protein